MPRSKISLFVLLLSAASAALDWFLQPAKSLFSACFEFAFLSQFQLLHLKLVLHRPKKRYDDCSDYVVFHIKKLFFLTCRFVGE